MEIRLAGLEPESIVDGPGYRFTVFVQGCPHNCPGCHNPQTHDFSSFWHLYVPPICGKREPERFDIAV